MRNLILIATLFIFGCSGKQSLIIEKLKIRPSLYTLSNIQVDLRGNKISTVNYQLGYDFIPVCTRVEIRNYDKKSLKLVNYKTKDLYSVKYHKRVEEPIDEFVAKFVGPECPKEEIKKLSRIDKKGIKYAKPFIGMSKKGIIIAMGYPPSHVRNNYYKSHRWTYWKHKFGKKAIMFNDKDIVEKIID